MSNDNKLNLIVVTGQAGSGKSTYCKNLQEKGYIYVAHDAWVNDRFDASHYISEEAWFLIYLLGQDILDNENKCINRKKVAARVFADKDLNKIVVSYFISKFAVQIKMMADRQNTIDNKNLVIEIPYLDFSIRWLKSQFPHMKVVYTYADHKIIADRLRARGWDENRIAYSADFYLNSARANFDLIDETITT